MRGAGGAVPAGPAASPLAARRAAASRGDANSLGQRRKDLSLSDLVS